MDHLSLEHADLDSLTTQKLQGKPGPYQKMNNPKGGSCGNCLLHIEADNQYFHIQAASTNTYITIYHYISLYITICHYISLYITIYHYISLYITIYHYISLYITIYHYILYITIYYISLYITIYHYISLNITMVVDNQYIQYIYIYIFNIYIYISCEIQGTS